MSHISIRHPRALGLFALLVFGSVAGPALADHDGPGATLFRDVYFEGRQETFYGDIPDLQGTHIGNDVVSSIALDRGCRATIYSDAHFRGRSITLHHDLADLRRTHLGNDRVSSLRVDCRGVGRGRRGPSGPEYGGFRGRGVTVYADADFRGRSETFVHDDPDLRDNAIRQDTISSVAVDRACRVILYADVGYRGRETVVRGDHENLSYSDVGNDRVSSIRVDCRR